MPKELFELTAKRAAGGRVRSYHPALKKDATEMVAIIPLSTNKLVYIYGNYDFDDDEMNIIGRWTLQSKSFSMLALLSLKPLKWQNLFCEVS